MIYILLLTIVLFLLIKIETMKRRESWLNACLAIAEKQVSDLRDKIVINRSNMRTFGKHEQGHDYE